MTEELNEERRLVYFQVTETEYELLKALALAEGVSVSEWAKEQVEKFVKRMKKSPGEGRI